MRHVLHLLLFSWLMQAQGLWAQCDIQLAPVVTHVTCFGGHNGAIQMNASNGTGPYFYAWSSTAATTQTITDLAAGMYSCTVTDNVGCTASTTVMVTQPADLLVTGFEATLTCAIISVTVPINVTGGTQPYQYFWSNGATGQTASFNLPGSYQVTVSDLNGCTKIVDVVINEDIVMPLACIDQSVALTCTTPVVQLNATCSSQGANYTYQWSSPNGIIVGGHTTLTPYIGSAGTYQLIVTNTINGCTAAATVGVAEDFLVPSASAGPDLHLPCGGGGVLTLIGSALNASVFNWSGPGILSGGNTANPIVNEPGVYTLIVSNTSNGCTASDTMQVTGGGNALCSTITGRVMVDTVANCQLDAGEPGVFSWIVQATNGIYSYFGVTDSSGAFAIAVEPGDIYTVSPVAPNTLWGLCSPGVDVPVPNEDETYDAGDFMVQKLAGCPLLSVSMTSGNLRRCFSNNFFNVWYCNDGTADATGAYVEVTLDPFLSIEGASIPYTDLGNQVIRFDVGDLHIGECRSFHFNTKLSCGAVIGQTHCSEAHIYPDSSCLPPNILWTGASLKISSQCDTDSVRFKIENTGIGNMATPLDYIVIEDQIMLMTAPLQLNAGEVSVVNVPANGSTWRLEMEQEPYHPGLSSPAVSVEGCTTGSTFTVGYVTQFPSDDADPFIDIHCVENTGSFDPNDKQAFPKGYGDRHYIKPGTPLEYLIRFQNTGNDTAFTVVLVDSLSKFLDPATFRAGASSHPYTWKLRDEGILSFHFDHILLPDSTTNEPASHGFVQFSVLPKASAPLESRIENFADIYFDFNDPVRTNTVYHQLGENFISVSTWTPEQPNYQVSVSPNPFSNSAVLSVSGPAVEAPLYLRVFDLQGQTVMEMESDNAVFRLQQKQLPEGIYLFEVTQEGKHIGSGRMAVVR